MRVGVSRPGPRARAGRERRERETAPPRASGRWRPPPYTVFLSLSFYFSFASPYEATRVRSVFARRARDESTRRPNRNVIATRTEGAGGAAGSPCRTRMPVCDTSPPLRSPRVRAFAMASTGPALALPNAVKEGSGEVVYHSRPVCMNIVFKIPKAQLARSRSSSSLPAPAQPRLCAWSASGADHSSIPPSLWMSTVEAAVRDRFAAQIWPPYRIRVHVGTTRPAHGDVHTANHTCE